VDKLYLCYKVFVFFDEIIDRRKTMIRRMYLNGKEKLEARRIIQKKRVIFSKAQVF
jgi:hypothetical protein